MDPAVSMRKFDRELRAVREDGGVTGVERWELPTSTWPEFAVVFTHPLTKRRVGFQFQFDDWDEVPPSLSLFDPEGGGELPWEKWPKGGWSVGNPHPVTGKPFLCLPGIREYHTHHSHLKDLWENYLAKDSYGAGYIIHRVWQRFRETNG